MRSRTVARYADREADGKPPDRASPAGRWEARRVSDARRRGPPGAASSQGQPADRFSAPWQASPDDRCGTPDDGSPAWPRCVRWWGSGASTGDDARPGDGYGVALADGDGSPDALGAGEGAGVIAGIGGAVAIGPLPLGYVSGTGRP